MSARRARVQYGKASKRVNSRFTSEIVQIQPKEGETTTDDGGNQGGATKEVRPRRNKSKDTASAGLKELPTKRTSQRQAIEGSRAPVRRNESRQDYAPRKRKRDASPASSDLTDVVDEEAPAPKALKVSKGASTPGKAVSPAKVSDARRTPSRPLTPNKPAAQTPKLTRDLSDLFISPRKPVTSAMATSPPKPGLLKRMLSKAKTEPVLDEIPAPVDLFPSKSMVPSSQSPSRDTTANSAMPSFNRHPLARNRTPSPTPLQDTRPISRSPQRIGRTYSKSRSFLIEIPRDTSVMDVDNEAPAASTIPEDPDLKDIHRESYSELRSRWGIDSSEQDPTLNTPTNDLNSIGEMRSRGETRRFLDEVGYLFDGLDPSTGRGNTGAKRASAIEIVSKMGNSEFSRRAVAANFVSKAWSMLRGAGAGTGEDKILDAALIAFAALSMKDARHAAELSRANDLLPFLSLSIGVPPDEDVLVAPPPDQESLWARKLGLSRMDRTNLNILRVAVANSIALGDGEVASHRLLAAQTLSSLLESGQPLTGEVLDAVVLSLSSELSHLSVLQSPSSLEEISLPNIRYTRTCLRIAEKVLINQPGSVERQKELLPLLARLVNLWPAQLESAAISPDLDESTQLALQYLVRATHDNLHLAELLAKQPSLIHNLLRLFARWYRQHFSTESARVDMAEPEDVDEDLPDLLTRASLSLALITQLVRQGDTAKVVLQETQMATSCPFTGPCTDQCHCQDQVSGVKILVEIFDESDGGHDAKADYFRGHIGILLSLLCLHNEQSRSAVLLALKPRQGTDQEKMQTLVASVREFSTVWSAVVNTVNQGDEVSSEASGGGSTQDEGAKLAQTVIEGLEQLLSESP